VSFFFKHIISLVLISQSSCLSLPSAGITTIPDLALFFFFLLAVLGLALARQVLYHLSHALTPFHFSYFSYRVYRFFSPRDSRGL
jgi:hypothetical protein